MLPNGFFPMAELVSRLHCSPDKNGCAHTAAVRCISSVPLCPTHVNLTELLTGLDSAACGHSNLT